MSKPTLNSAIEKMFFSNRDHFLSMARQFLNTDVISGSNFDGIRIPHGTLSISHLSDGFYVHDEDDTKCLSLTAALLLCASKLNSKSST